MRYPIELGNNMGVTYRILQVLTLYYTKMCFKILNFSNAIHVSLSPEQSTLGVCVRPTVYDFSPTTLNFLQNVKQEPTIPESNLNLQYLWKKSIPFQSNLISFELDII
jgi:hypothetical protein